MWENSEVIQGVKEVISESFTGLREFVCLSEAYGRVLRSFRGYLKDSLRFIAIQRVSEALKRVPEGFRKILMGLKGISGVPWAFLGFLRGFRGLSEAFQWISGGFMESQRYFKGSLFQRNDSQENSAAF